MFRRDLKGWKRWASKGSLAIVDQVFISGSNFLVSILLARWSSASEYGAFALAFAVFLLLSQLHQSLLLEPMSVFGGSYSGGRLKRYYGSLLHMQNGLFVAIFVLLAVAASACHFFRNGHELGVALWGVAIASPAVLLFWMARRAFYLEHAPRPAAIGAVIYSIATVVGLAAVWRLGALTAFTAFLVMGVAALVTGAAMLLRLKPRFQRDDGDPAFAQECRQHWHYGAWALAGALAMWLPQNVYYAVLTGADGMAAAGDIRALLNFALPLQRITVALGLLLLPYMAKAYSTRGRRGAQSFTRAISYLFVGGSLAYWAIVLLFRTRIFHLLYAGKYLSVAHLLPWLALSSILNAVIAALVIGLRAMRSPASVFYAYLASCVVAVGLGVPATWRWGVVGVIASFVVSNIATLVAALWMMYRLESAADNNSEHVSGSARLTLGTVVEAKAS